MKILKKGAGDFTIERGTLRRVTLPKKCEGKIDEGYFEYSSDAELHFV